MNTELYNHYIISVYECGSLTQAAGKLGISQPALSSGLTGMEKKLGFKIFDRKVSPVRLTREGEIYLEYLYKERRLITDYQRRIADIQGTKTGKLVVGGPVVYVNSLIVKAVVRFRELYPDCRVLIKNDSVPSLIERAENGDMDCFISTSDELPEKFQKIFIKKEKIYLCIPKDWEVNKALSDHRVSLGERGSEFEYRLLDGLEYIFLEENQPLQKSLEQFFEEKQISPQNHFQVNQVSAGVRLAALGAGAMIASEEAIQESGQEERLSLYSMPEQVSGRNIYAVCNGERYIPHTCQKLIKLLQEVK